MLITGQCVCFVFICSGSTLHRVCFVFICSGGLHRVCFVFICSGSTLHRVCFVFICSGSTLHRVCFVLICSVCHTPSVIRVDMQWGSTPSPHMVVSKSRPSSSSSSSSLFIQGELTEHRALLQQ